VSEGMAVNPTSRPARPRRRPAGLAWSLWALTLLALPATAWLDRLLRQAGTPELTWLRPSSIPQVAAAVSAATVGAVLASRRPRHPVGWLLLGLGLSLTLWGLTFGYSHYGLVVRPGSLPAAGYLAGFHTGLTLIWLSCAGFVLLLTPTGSLPSPHWRWWAKVAAAAAVLWLLASLVHPTPLYPDYPTIGNPLAIPAIPRELLDVALPVAGVLILVSLLVGAGSLVARFRRARGAERLQLRWLAWGRRWPRRRCWSPSPAWEPSRAPPCSMWRWGSARRCCRWLPGRRSCAIGCMTWIASSAAPWRTRC
jgi:hypothetical protein